MSNHQPLSYNRETTLSKETFEKYRKKRILRFDVKAIIAGWYKVGDSIQLYKEVGGFTDQLIFQKDNPHAVLQGYSFRG